MWGKRKIWGKILWNPMQILWDNGRSENGKWKILKIRNPSMKHGKWTWDLWDFTRTCSVPWSICQKMTGWFWARANVGIHIPAPWFRIWEISYKITREDTFATSQWHVRLLIGRWTGHPRPAGRSLRSFFQELRQDEHYLRVDVCRCL